MTDFWRQATAAVQRAAFAVWRQTVTFHREGLDDLELADAILRAPGERVDVETGAPIFIDGLQIDVRRSDLPGGELLPGDRFTVDGLAYEAGAPLDDSEGILRFDLYRFRQ